MKKRKILVVEDKKEALCLLEAFLTPQKLLFCVFSLLYFISFPFVTLAQEEELLFFAKEEVVVTAAKSEQKITETAAIVAVITGEQIRNRGYQSVVDILKDVIGIDIIDNVARVEIGIRGINNKSDYGKRILFLLNGHDMGWKQFSRSRIYPSVANIDDIKRVEIIRGPGSALWGDSAILGIINVITKSAEDIDGVEVTVGGGSYHTLFESIIIGKAFDNGIKLYFSASGYKDDTSSARRFKEYSEILGYEVYAEGQKQNDYNIYGNISYGDFTLTGYKSRFDVFWPMATWGLTGDDTRLILDKWFVKLNFNHAFSKEVEVKISASYDNYKFSPGSQYENYPGYQGQPANGWFIRKMVGEDDFIESEIQLTYQPLWNLKLVSGFEYEHLDTLRWHYPYKKDGTLDLYWVENPPEFTTQSWATYLQAEYHPLKELGITSGFRYDKHSIYGGVISPRLGIVFNPTKRLTFKGLYGEAFYGPSIHETYYVKKDSSYGNPELKPEIIKTYEFALGYRQSRLFSTNIIFFQNTLTDIIAYKMTEPGQIVGNWGDYTPTKASNQYNNIGKAQVRGVEAKFRSMPYKNLDLYLYLTFRDPKNLDNDTRLENTPRFVWGGAFNLFLFDRLNVNLNMRYLGDRISIREKDRKNPPYPTLYMDLDRKTDPYYVANLTLKVEDAFLKGLELRASVNNLFDKEYYDPGRVEDYPQLGRHVIFSAKYKF